MQIDNYNVYDMEESIIASGFPMKHHYDAKDFSIETSELLFGWQDEELTEDNSRHYKRICKLSNTPLCSGHANALSGIVVSVNITATVKWWEQFQRYHFKQIVSSMSSMHRLRTMMKEDTIRFNDKTDPEVIEKFKSLINDPNVDDETLAYSCPMGLELTARITTNYLQLKTMYFQRKTHKLEEWRIMCDWIEKLPLAKELITGE